jgi:hypothetical protein
MAIIVIANIQQMIRNMNVEQVLLKASLSPQLSFVNMLSLMIKMIIEKITIEIIEQGHKVHQVQPAHKVLQVLMEQQEPLEPQVHKVRLDFRDHQE